MNRMACYEKLVGDYTPPVDSPAARETIKRVFLAWTEAIDNKDLDTLRGLMAEDIVIELPFNESGKTDKDSYRIYRGVESCLSFWATAFKAEGEMHEPSEMELTITADGSRLFLECRGHLTMASGKDYRNRYVMRMDVADGKVLHCKEYYNPIQSAYAFGRPIAGQFMLEKL